MANGYTQGVRDGEVQEFSDFALRCARAFGCYVALRDEPPGPIPDELPDCSYDAELLRRISIKLEILLSMSPDAIIEETTRGNKELVLVWEQSETCRTTAIRRYETMQKKVQAWAPPTPDHRNLKAFMERELRAAIMCEGTPAPRPTPLSPTEWHELRLQAARETLAYYQSRMHRERQNLASNREWAQQLRDSLKDEG